MCIEKTQQSLYKSRYTNEKLRYGCVLIAVIMICGELSGGGREGGGNRGKEGEGREGGGGRERGGGRKGRGREGRGGGLINI